MRDAEIFVPMVPLTKSTRGLMTRALICDMSAIRRRGLNDELALAADVFDMEPLPLDDPLLGRPNVVHTPHNAGRTKEANFRWAEMLLEQFVPE